MEEKMNNDMTDILIDSLFNPYLDFLIIVAIIIFILIFIILFFKYLKFKDSNYKNASGNSFVKTIFNAGNNGEYLTFAKLEKLKGDNKIMTNLYIPRKDKITTEVDLIMISQTGIYVFESKNYSGWVFGNEKQKNWTQTLQNGKKHKFFNPIWQNNTHINALKYALELEEDIFKSYIIFNERCTLKKITLTSENIKVIRRNRLIRELNKDISESKKLLNKDQIDSIYNELSQYILVDEKTKQEHIESIKNQQS